MNQPYNAPPQGGTLYLVIQGNIMTSTPNAPTVALNGYRVPVRYGTNTIPAPAGPVRIEVHAQWLRKFGQAVLDTAVYPGRVTTVHYAPPYHQFTTGSIGHEKQQRKGVVGLILTLVLIVVMVALVVAVAL